MDGHLQQDWEKNGDLHLYRNGDGRHASYVYYILSDGHLHPLGDGDGHITLSMSYDKSKY